jgi:hypothetical protein
VRASRLVAVRTPRGERRAVLRLDARAEGSRAVDEPPCPRHVSFHPLDEVGGEPASGSPFVSVGVQVLKKHPSGSAGRADTSL